MPEEEVPEHVDALHGEKMVIVNGCKPGKVSLDELMSCCVGPDVLLVCGVLVVAGGAGVDIFFGDGLGEVTAPYAVDDGRNG